MATYNLNASDLITLLNSTVTNPTGRAILESVSGAFSSAFPFANTSVQTTEGPADTVPAGYANKISDTVGAGVQLELIVVPTSTTITGSAYPPGAVGTETSGVGFSLFTSGGVVIGTGDQYVGVTDNNLGSAADTIIGGAYLERLISGSGSNLLIAGSGANSLVGGAGADTLMGGGNSRLVAGSGSNTLKSSTLVGGHDTLIGGSGNDRLIAQAGDNRLKAGSGTNTLVGGSGNDTLISGGQTTFQLGSGSARIVESMSGSHDTIDGGSGTDTIVTALGTTNLGVSIVGSSGGLRVVDLAGSNTIVGGSGADTVVLSRLNGSVRETNTSNQTITAGSGGVRVVTNEAFANYQESTTGGVHTVTFTDTGQTLSINDLSGNSVTLVFGDGHTPVKL